MSVTVRIAVPEDAGQIARVHIASWRTTYRGIVPDDLLDRLATEPRERFWGSIIANPAGAEFVYVAESPVGEVIGFASGGPAREGNPEFAIELYAIYLLEQWQRGGIGRQLTREIVQVLLARGHDSMLLWVLADNPSRGFYERLGGVVIGEKVEDIGGKQLSEVAYGWSDLRRLADVLDTR